MKALVISPQPFFSPRGTPFSVYYRTMITSEQGVDIDLLTYGEGQDVDLPGVTIIRIPRFKFLGNVKIGPSFLKLFLDVFIFIWTFKLLCRNRYDFVHAHEEAIFFCSFLKPFFKFKLLYDMHSSLPQQLINFQFTTLDFLIKLFEKLEKFSIKRSDAVITICPDLSNYVKTVIDDQTKEFLIENSIFDSVKSCNTTDHTKTDQEKWDVIEAVFSSGKSIVVYTGTLETYQGIEMALNAFKEVVNLRKDVKLLIVGGSDRQVKFYSKLSKEIGVADSVKFVGLVSKDIAIECTNSATVLISPRIKGTNTPLKIYEQIASGTPLVATKIYSHTQVLNEDVAFLAEPDASDFAVKIVEALENIAKSKRIAEKAKQLYDTRYSRMAYIDKIRQLISRLV